MSFEVIKWVYNKTFVEIMKNTVHFRNFENFWNGRKTLAWTKVMSRSVRTSGFSSWHSYFRLY